MLPRARRPRGARVTGRRTARPRRRTGGARWRTGGRCRLARLLTRREIIGIDSALPGIGPYHLPTVSAEATLEGSAGDGALAGGRPRTSAAIFDIPIDLAQPTELLRTISVWASEPCTRRVMYVNAHVVNQSRVTPVLGG